MLLAYRKLLHGISCLLGEALGGHQPTLGVSGTRVVSFYDLIVNFNIHSVTEGSSLTEAVDEADKSLKHFTQEPLFSCWQYYS